MSDPRNKINCAKCHSTKCTLSGKAFDMVACTGYKPLTHYDELHSMNVERLAEWIEDNSCNAMWCYPFPHLDNNTGTCALEDCKQCIVKWPKSEVKI